MRKELQVCVFLFSFNFFYFSSSSRGYSSVQEVKRDPGSGVSVEGESNMTHFTGVCHSFYYL